MTKNNSAPLISHLMRRGDIEVHLSIAHHSRIQEKRLLICRLTVLHVDLSGHALDTIDN